MLLKETPVSRSARLGWGLHLVRIGSGMEFVVHLEVAEHHRDRPPEERSYHLRRLLLARPHCRKVDSWKERRSLDRQGRVGNRDDPSRFGERKDDETAY